MTAAVGISQTGTGAWQWQCSCGAAGEDASREVARDQYKTHRRDCGSNQPEAKSMTEPKKEAAAKPAAKPAAAKPAAAAKGRKKREQSVKEADVKAVLARLKEGKTSLIAESKKLGFSHNGPLRAALRNLIGVAAYSKLMEASTTAKKPAAKKPAAKKTSGKKTTSKPKTPAAPPAETETAMVNNVPPVAESAKEEVTA